MQSTTTTLKECDNLLKAKTGYRVGRREVCEKEREQNKTCIKICNAVTRCIVQSHESKTYLCDMEARVYE